MRYVQVRDTVTAIKFRGETDGTFMKRVEALDDQLGPPPTPPPAPKTCEACKQEIKDA